MVYELSNIDQFITQMLMIHSMTGAQFTHVPFEGGESVITAVLGGHVEVTCDSLPKVRSHAEAGKLRILLMTNKMPDFPEGEKR